MRILVLGGDAFTDPRGVFVRLDDICIAHGKANPVPASINARPERFVLLYPEDSKAGEIADLWARKRGVTSNRWDSPNWFRVGAPHIISDGRPDVVVAYPETPRFLLRAARRAGVRVVDAT